MQDFRFLQYHTEYSCKGEFKKRMHSDICFGHVFDSLIDDTYVTEEYKILLYPGLYMCRYQSLSNACLFTIEQVRNHIRQLQSICPFTYRVTHNISRKFERPVFKIHLKLENAPALFHKYILTWIRYLYEYPYNVLMLDTYKLKQEKIFRFTSIDTLFNIVLACYNGTTRDIHQISCSHLVKSLTRNQIKQKLTEVYYLNDIYEEFDKYIEHPMIKDNFNKLDIYDLEYWTDPNSYNDRKSIYLKVFNLIRECESL